MIKKSLKIGIICVCYNSHDSFIKYYKSIKKAEKSSSTEVYLFLLDNSSVSSENELDFIKNIEIEDKNFRYIKTKNQGYLGTVQNNFSKLGLSNINLNYICLTNVDIAIDIDFFNRLETICLGKKLGLIAPSIINKNQIDKNPKLIKRKKMVDFLINIFLFSFPLTFRIQKFMSHWKSKIYRELKLKKNILNKEIFPFKEIYCAHGSFLVFTNKAFLIIMKEKYPIFLFGEELFFAELLLTNKLQTFFVPSLKVYDDEHVSTGKLKVTYYCKLNIKAILYIIKRFYLKII